MYVASPIRKILLAGKTQHASDGYWARQDAYNYATIFPDRHRRQIAFTEEHLFPRLKPDARVIDIGCADGWHSLVVARQCGELVGYDYNQKFVDLATQTAAAQEITNCSFIFGNALELRFPPATADAVVMSGLMTCLVRDRDAMRALRIAADVLKSGSPALFKDTLHRGVGTRLNVQDAYGAAYRDLARYRNMIERVGLRVRAEGWIDDGEEYGSFMALAEKAIA